MAKGVAAPSVRYRAQGAKIKRLIKARGRRSIAGLEALDQFAHGRHVAVGVKRVRGKAISVVPGKHQLELDIVRVADRLQRFLDAVTPRIGLLAGRGGLVLRPVRELAGAETAHAFDRVGADLER